MDTRMYGVIKHGHTRTHQPPASEFEYPGEFKDNF
jgi:hypothetical protein